MLHAPRHRCGGHGRVRAFGSLSRRSSADARRSAAFNDIGLGRVSAGNLWKIPRARQKNVVPAHLVHRANEIVITLLPRRPRWGSCSFDGPTRCGRNSRNKPHPDARCVPRETITKRGSATTRARPPGVSRRGVYSGRRPHRRVNTQLSNLFVATRPLNSMRLAVSENASRIRPVGRAVTMPTPDQGDEAGGELEDEEGPAFALPDWPMSVDRRAPGPASACSAGVTAVAAGAADPKPAMARLASAGPPLRASSIIPSNRPRIETPRRAASASTQARRSWSRRMPTTVDFEVAMAPFTVILGVYISGAEWWQPGGGHRGRNSFRSGRGTYQRRVEASSTARESSRRLQAVTACVP